MDKTDSRTVAVDNSGDEEVLLLPVFVDRTYTASVRGMLTIDEDKGLEVR